ncbi:MAG: segregation/condensation protein A [Anaerolineaceae bacterium]
MSRIWETREESYEILTDEYSGPLDLLLDLIQKAELDITKFALAQVTDQFLAYVRNNQDADPEYISEFLVIATKLIQIKSEAMLPHPPDRLQEEEDPGEALARQLYLYREVKTATHWMNQRMLHGERGYLHIAPRYPVTAQIDLSGIDVQDLILALENISNNSQYVQIGTVISIPKITLRKKVQEIINLLQSQPNTRFSELLGKDHSRINSIVVFLSVLELVKQHLILTEQKGLFGDIEITAESDIQSTSSMDLLLED